MPSADVYRLAEEVRDLPVAEKLELAAALIRQGKVELAAQIVRMADAALTLAAIDARQKAWEEGK